MKVSLIHVGVFGLFGGSFVDRVGRKPLLVWSTLLSAVSLAGFGVASGVVTSGLLHFL